MGDNAFFFQGGSLVLPQGMALNAINLEIPLTDTPYLPVLDRFTATDIGGGVIAGVVVPLDFPLSPHWQAISVRQALSVLADYPVKKTGAIARLLRAFHIAQWRQESLFCGSCGGKNTDADTGELARLCPACGRMEFPRISPAVILRITNREGHLLLAHNARFSPGVYSLIAGFVEAGETLEAAAIRETREETGIAIGDIQYLDSQPWPFPHSLTVAFSARHIEGTLKPDGVEIKDARWFTRDSLPTLPGTGSMSRRLIEEWLVSSG
jgi:NAD+ diphosphatase